MIAGARRKSTGATEFTTVPKVQDSEVDELVQAEALVDDRSGAPRLTKRAGEGGLDAVPGRLSLRLAAL